MARRRVLDTGLPLQAEAVSFDATGTLLHCPRLGEIYHDVLSRHGLVAQAAVIAAMFREVWRELDCTVPSGADRFAAEPEGGRGFWHRLLLRLCQRLEMPEPSPFAAAELYDRFSHAEAWEVYPDVLPALVELRARGLRLGVVGNWDRRLPVLLERLGLLPYFDAVLVSEELGIAKPDPEVFRHAARQLRCEPGDLVHVGDSQRHDVEGALAAGCQALLLDRTGAKGDLESLVELPPLVGRKGEPGERQRL